MNRSADSAGNLGLILLFGLYTFDYIDRHLLALSVEELRRDVGISDWQAGLLGGFAAPAVAAIPALLIARYADRAGSSRPLITGIGLAICSVATVFTGAGRSFIQLFVARLAFGLGESAAHPAARSLIADLASEERRGRAMSIYGMGMPMGKLIGLSGGGLLIGLIGWRATFTILGLPGLALAAILVLRLVDPRRLAKDQKIVIGRPHQQRVRLSRGYWLMCAAATALATMGASQSLFGAAYFIRVHHLSASQTGLILGIILGLGGLASTFASGILVDRASRIDRRAVLLAPAITSLIAAALLLAAFLAQDTGVALACFALGNLFFQAWHAPLLTGIQGALHDQQRSTGAFYEWALVQIIAGGLGPFMAGFLSNALSAGFSLGDFTLPAQGASSGLRLALAFSTSWCIPAVIALLSAASLRPQTSFAGRPAAN